MPTYIIRTYFLSFFQSGLFFLLGPCTGSIDEYMSCDRYFENKRSARLLDDIPCDMSKVSYCQHKGKGYPE